MLTFGVVIPVCAGREDNLRLVLDCLARQTRQPDQVVVIVDGEGFDSGFPVSKVFCAKHEPGMEQPRNVGVRALGLMDPKLTHVVFLDSDVVVGPTWLADIAEAYETGDASRVMVCPYDWLPDGMRPDTMGEHFWEAAPAANNDPRWEMFSHHPSSDVFLNDLSAGLACFSGNLVWPVSEFKRVGGFWAEIHHGRCEDGELGLRAVSMQVPISLARGARGYHLWHPINRDLAVQRNARDVPMLNERHPWIERGAVYLSDRDGGAFDVRCSCGRTIPTIGWWNHVPACETTRTFSLPVLP